VPQLRADRELVLVAVRQDCAALRHTAAGPRANRGVVLAALAQCPWAL
jgi:hypothetical protein